MLPRLPLLGKLYVVQEGFRFGKEKQCICRETSEGSQFVPCARDNSVYEIIPVEVFGSTFSHPFCWLVLSCAPTAAWTQLFGTGQTKTGRRRPSAILANVFLSHADE